MSYKNVLIPTVLILFKAKISLLAFCLDDLFIGSCYCSTTKILPYMFIHIHFVYLGAFVLGACMLMNTVSSSYINFKKKSLYNALLCLLIDFVSKSIFSDWSIAYSYFPVVSVCMKCFFIYSLSIFMCL